MSFVLVGDEHFGLDSGWVDFEMGLDFGSVIDVCDFIGDWFAIAALENSNSFFVVS